MTLPRMRVAQLRIQSPGCRKPNPGTAGPHFLWLHTPTGEPGGNGSSVCSLVSAAWPKPFPVRAGGSELQRQADRSHPKALSRAERLPAPFRRQKTLPAVCCSVPRSFHPPEPHPGGNTGTELSPRGTGATTRPSYRTPKAPCLCWVSTPTNDNWPSDKSAGPANSSPPACPCTSHLSSTLPAPDLAQYTASSEMHVHLASRFSDWFTNQRSPGA